MLSAVFLIIVIFSVVIQDVIKKHYNCKNNNKGALIFCLMSVLTAMVVFIASANHPLNFKPELIPFSFGFATAYATAMVFAVYALQYGPLALTSLVVSYSLLIPTSYGIISGEKPTKFFYMGMLLLIVSIFLFNFNFSKKDKEEKTKISPKWIIYVSLLFIGNGMCSATQSIQIDAFNKQYSSEFMILALAMVAVIIFVVMLFTERKDVASSIKNGGVLAILCGAFNGIVNLLIIVIQQIGDIPKSVLFPCVSGGGMILTFIFAVVLFKEKMTKAQTAGFFVGVASVVFLNL